MLPAWAVASPARRAHIERVTALLGHWAAALGLPRDQEERWLQAAWLHDALRDAPLADPLRHGPAAADRAAADGECDQGILSAVRYHSVGWAGWDDVGRALYCADFLEPGREYGGAELDALAERFPADPDGVVWEVARRRVSQTVLAGWPLPPETVAFWNALCESRR